MSVVFVSDYWKDVPILNSAHPVVPLTRNNTSTNGSNILCNSYLIIDSWQRNYKDIHDRTLVPLVHCESALYKSLLDSVERMTLHENDSKLKLPDWAVKPATYSNPTNMDADRDEDSVDVVSWKTLLSS